MHTYMHTYIYECIHQVLGALEVEAHFGHVFKEHEEEMLQVLAGTTSALLDIMRQIRSGDSDKKKGWDSQELASDYT